MSLYAVDKFSLTSFLIGHNKLYNGLFIRKEMLYTLTDVYEQIEHVANTVSSFVVAIIFSCNGMIQYVPYSGGQYISLFFQIFKSQFLKTFYCSICMYNDSDCLVNQIYIHQIF